MDIKEMKWTREPSEYVLKEDLIEIKTEPHTDLWQRTYYHFRNDNAPALQYETDEKFFSFVVKTDFADSNHRFDQCGIVMYLDSLDDSMLYECPENCRFTRMELVLRQYRHLSFHTGMLNGQVAVNTDEFPMWVSDADKFIDDGVFFGRYRKGPTVI